MLQERWAYGASNSSSMVGQRISGWTSALWRNSVKVRLSVGCRSHIDMQAGTGYRCGYGFSSYLQVFHAPHRESDTIIVQSCCSYSTFRILLPHSLPTKSTLLFLSSRKWEYHTNTIRIRIAATKFRLTHKSTVLPPDHSCLVQIYS